MIAAVPDGSELHVVFWTGRRGLKAVSTSYCSREFNAGDGVLQVPESILNGQAIVTPDGSMKVCPKCKEKLPK